MKHPMSLNKLSEKEVLEELGEIDTPTISNVVATYPKRDICLKLYDAWYGGWYTDTSLKCVYPALGPIVGHVATVVFCEKSEKFTGVSRWALPDHIESTAKPVDLRCRRKRFSIPWGPPSLFRLQPWPQAFRSISLQNQL